MKIFITVTTFVVIFILYVRFLEATSVFLPAKEILDDPANHQLKYEDVFIKSGAFKIHGWYVPMENAHNTLLFFHGNAGNIGDRLSKIIFFRNLGFNVFIVDYRGYGKSSGKSTEQTMYEDAQAAYDYLVNKRDISAEKIVIYGASLGGAAAVDLASKKKVGGIIIDSSFTSAKDMGKVIYPFIPSFLLSLQLDSASKIKNMSIPKLFFHSRDDRTVPFKLGEKLYNVAKDPKEFVIIDGSHNEGHNVSSRIYWDGINDFLDKHNLRN